MSKDDDYTTSPEWQAWQEDVLEHLVPMMRDSEAVMSLVPKGDTDVKFAVELGFSIMMDKPIIALVVPGVQIPPKLARIADEIVEADFDDPEGTTIRIHQAMSRIGLDNGRKGRKK